MVSRLILDYAFYYALWTHIVLSHCALLYLCEHAGRPHEGDAQEDGADGQSEGGQGGEEAVGEEEGGGGHHHIHRHRAGEGPAGRARELLPVVRRVHALPDAERYEGVLRQVQRDSQEQVPAPRLFTPRWRRVGAGCAITLPARSCHPPCPLRTARAQHAQTQRDAFPRSLLLESRCCSSRVCV